MPDPLDTLVENVRASKKYRSVSLEFVRRVGSAELQRQPNLKAAIKATKSKLHQTAAAYQQVPAYDRWLDDLRHSEDVRETCRDIMRAHASTAERLPILDTFFATTLADLSPVTSVIDAACGLNPLAALWMPLAPGAPYYAYDVYEDMAAFLNSALPLLGIDGRAAAQDIGTRVPAERVQLALVLKTLPCLEQVDKTAGLALLENLEADYLLVSYPARSLGGRSKGMVAHYDAHFRALIAEKPWPVQSFTFSTELAFLVDKR